jgi:glycosyltransferase involved in cell wall biosynthesis
MDIATAPYPPDEAGDSYFSPLKIYEYLAAGLPVVASGVGQIPAALDDGALGVLVVPGDAEKLAEALRALRADQPSRAVFARDGRLAALQRHTWKQVAIKSILGLGASR